MNQLTNLKQRWNASAKMRDMSLASDLVRAYESELSALQGELAERESLLKVSGGLKCPNCDDTGAIPRQDGYGEWYPEQCEFCYTVEDSIFNRNLPAFPTDKE